MRKLATLSLGLVAVLACCLQHHRRWHLPDSARSSAGASVAASGAASLAASSAPSAAASSGATCTKTASRRRPPAS